MRVIILVAVVVFLIDLGAVVGMHTKKHSASPTTTTVPTTSTAPSTSATSATSAPTSSSVPLTTPLTTPSSVPTSSVSTPSTSEPVTSPSVTSAPVTSPPVTSPPVTSPPVTVPATTTTTIPVTTAPPAGRYTYAIAGTATAGGQTYQLGTQKTSPITVSSATCTLNSALSGEQFAWTSLDSPPNSGSVTTEECLATGGVYITSEVFAGNIFLPQSIMCSNVHPVFLPISGSASGQTGVCTSSDGASTADVTVTLVGRGDTTLTDGQVVPTTEDTVVIKFVSGAETGALTTTYHLAADGVVVSENGGANLTSSNGAGPAQTYNYGYGLTLSSLTPSG